MKDANSATSTATLGSTCTVIAGQSPKASFYNDAGNGLPFYQGKKEFTDRYLGSPTTWTTSVTKRAEAGDILMSVRAPVGPINEATEAICIGRGLAAIRPGDRVSRDYLWYALLWLQPEIKGNAGAVFESINKAGIEKLEIPLPALEEQQRIVEVLDEAFEGLARARAHAEANLQNARDLYRAGLTALTFRAIGGHEVALADAVAPDSSITYGVVKPGPEGEIPFVRGGDLRDGKIDVDALRTITKEVSDTYNRTKLRGGELLLCLVGQPGQTGVVPSSLRGANIARQTALIRLSRDFDAEFVSFFLLSDEGQSRLGAYTQGAIQQVINLKELKTVLIPKLPLESQKEISSDCEKMRSSTTAITQYYEQKIQDIDDLRQSLLQKAFAGELG